MMEEIRAKKAELLELTYQQIAIKQDELQTLQYRLEDIEDEIEKLCRLADNLA